MADYISRESVVDYLYMEAGGFSYFEMEVDDIVDGIEAIPAADVRPVVRGEWAIKKASIFPYGNDVCCSVCGYTMGSSFGYNFCPNCGADMRKENE